MFNHSLLDSSPARLGVLRKRHLLISTLVGFLSSTAVLWSLRLLAGETANRVLTTQSLLIGLAVGLSALMLCYVAADARQSRLRVWPWFILTLVLNVAGFLAYLLYSATKTGNWRRATVPAAYGLEVLLISALVLVPLMRIEALPKGFIITDVPPAPPPPPGPPRTARTVSRPTHHPTPVDPRMAPPVIPHLIAQIHDDPTPPSLEGPNVPGDGAPGGVRDGVPGEIFNGLGGVNAPPPPRHDEKVPQKIRRVNVGGWVQPPRLIYQRPPEYPPLAKMTHTEGTVRLEAVINRDGTVQDLKVVAGHPLLVKAALDAVSSWRYEPTRLNGQPVEVVMEFDVYFKLNE